MANITMYSTPKLCPNCRLLKNYLDEKAVEYNHNTDVDLMIKKGFTAVPVLEIDDKTYDRLDTAMMAIKNMLGEE